MVGERVNGDGDFGKLVRITEGDDENASTGEHVPGALGNRAEQNHEIQRRQGFQVLDEVGSIAPSIGLLSEIQ